MLLVTGLLPILAAGLVTPPGRPSRLPSIAASDALLQGYDAAHRAAAASEGSQGLGGGITATAWASKYEETDALRGAVRALREAASKCDGRVMLGICAEDAFAGVAALKAWVTNLELQRGVLHGMDKDGEPLDMSTFGSVYIKYNSQPTERDAGGTATLSGYGGDFRGVYLNIDLRDGEFRQYAVLPLDLYSEAGGGSAAAATASPPAPTVTTKTSAAPAEVPLADDEALRSAVDEVLISMLPAVEALGAVAAVESVCLAEGFVEVCYSGPGRLTRAIEFALKNDVPSVRRVEFVAGAHVAPGEEVLAGAALREPDADVAQARPEAPAVPARFSSSYRFVSRPVVPCARESASPTPLAALHSAGYTLLRTSEQPVCASTLAAIRASPFTPIFNGQSPSEAPRRLMGTSPKWAPGMEERFSAALRQAGMLRCTDGTDKVVRDCYALRSLPCHSPAPANVALDGRQPGHSDSPEPPGGSVSELAADDVPLSVMLAVEPGTQVRDPMHAACAHTDTHP